MEQPGYAEKLSLGEGILNNVYQQTLGYSLLTKDTMADLEILMSFVYQGI